MARWLMLGSVSAMSAALWACGSAPSVAPATESAANPPAKPGCGRQLAKVGPSRLAEQREGSVVALAREGNRTLAYVADEDSKAVHTVDLDSRRELATTRLEGRPAQLLVMADGRVAATLRDKGQVVVLEPGATPSEGLQARCTREVGAEPFGLAASPDDKMLLVTTGWSHGLVALNTADLNPLFAVDLPREPRSVVVDATGQRAFVSHAVGGDLSVVELSGKNEVRKIDLRVGKATPRSRDDKPRAGSQGYALVKAELSSSGNSAEDSPMLKGNLPPAPPRKKQPAPPEQESFTERILVPMVTVDPGDVSIQSQAYYGPVADGVGKEAPIVSVVDAHAERALTRTKIALGAPLGKECLLPRAAAFRKSSQTLLVACAGIDALVELDTRGSDPSRLELRRFELPAGPLGIGLDEAGERAVVWSQFEGKLSIVDLKPPGEKGTKSSGVNLVSVSYRPTADVAAIASGRILFHASDDLRVASDGVACASCHPDGRDDSLTWSTPEGPRQTIMLAGRTPNTAPYGWVGKHGDLKTYVNNTLNRLGGTGMSEPELAELVKFLDRIPGPSGHAMGSEQNELLDRGRALFFAENQGCASCHVSGAGTDKHTHDVGSKAKADAAGRFDTPSLAFVRGTAPYFHDGRYATLEEMLATTDSEMGHTAHLGQQDRKALRVFLEGL